MKFNQQAADEICRSLAKGESLRSILNPETRDDFLPGMTTFFEWLHSEAEFAKQYARAREVQGHVKFDEASDIAAKATVENVQVARLQIDTIKWQASKLVPKSYGEKVELEHSGAVKVEKIERIVIDTK